MLFIAIRCVLLCLSSYRPFVQVVQHFTLSQEQLDDDHHRICIQDHSHIRIELQLALFRFHRTITIIKTPLVHLFF